ncbi:MAG: Ribosomal RNA small subunit methyltransferase E [Candidatus Wolfebacteria bacterium GW2011_GWA1_47_6]|nr:MAG: Ribosomal RNA small subunit methyltransferase E [Candidatus Wolfebacteria bacterium GW2011_GWA1_47_6]
MRLHRFIGDFDCAQSSLLLVDPDVVNQILRVLRLGVGDRLILGDGNGNECIVEITDRQKNALAVAVIERLVNTNDPVVTGVLYCAIFKRENFELVVQKATEIGIAEIVPVLTQRTIKLDIKEERLRKIIAEAVEQSGRARVPVLHTPMTLEFALADAKRNDINLFFDLSDTPVTDVSLHGYMRRGMFVGPEGGWTEDETEKARVAGCSIVSCGALTFRGETAAIIASYVGTRD